MIHIPNSSQNIILGSIIEEGQNIHEDLNREDSRNDFSSLNEFERLVDETVEALKGKNLHGQVL